MTLRHWRAIWLECVSMTEQDRATGQAEELVWLGVPVDWAKFTFMSLCLDVAAPTQRHHVLVDLVEVARPDVCQWSDSCPHDVDLTDSENASM
jgi:hypothetical protein